MPWWVGVTGRSALGSSKSSTRSSSSLEEVGDAARGGSGGAEVLGSALAGINGVKGKGEGAGSPPWEDSVSSALSKAGKLLSSNVTSLDTRTERVLLSHSQ